MDHLKNLFSLELRKSRVLVKRIFNVKRPLEELSKVLQYFLVPSVFSGVVNICRVKLKWETNQPKFQEKEIVDHQLCAAQLSTLAY